MDVRCRKWTAGPPHGRSGSCPGRMPTIPIFALSADAFVEDERLSLEAA